MSLHACLKNSFLVSWIILSIGLIAWTLEDCELRPPGNITLPNADNTSITIQWRSPIFTDFTQLCYKDAKITYEVMYWRVNRNATAKSEIVDGGTDRYEIIGLRSRKYYSIKMRLISIATNQDGTVSVTSSQWSDTLTHGAIDGVPDKPSNLDVPEDFSNSIVLNWNPPHNPNGVITRYIISYKMKPSTHPNAPYRSLSTRNTSITIHKLEEDTLYTFWVSAQTRLGVGPPESIEFKTSSKSLLDRLDLIISLVVVGAVLVFVVIIGISRSIFKRLDPATEAVKQSDSLHYGSIDNQSREDTYSTSSTVSQWDIHLQQVTFGKRLMTTDDYQYKIYTGTFRNIRNRRKRDVVIKTCSDKASDGRRKKLRNEINILKAIGEHINIVQLIGVCENKGNLHEIQEYLPGGTLSFYLRENDSKLKKSPELLLQIAINIADGMEFVAKQKITHGDLSTNNILVGTSHMTVKISGFGNANRKGVQQMEIPLIRNWRFKSLESLLEGVYTTQSDIWSFGVVLWEVLSPGKTPYVELGTRETKLFLRDGKRLQKDRNWQDNIYQVMLQCWAKTPSHRPSFTNISNSLTGIKDKKQFYHNFMSEEVHYSSVNMEDYDIVNSGEFDEYDRKNNNKT